MSKITHTNMNAHANKVTDLKRDLMAQYKNNEQAAIDILRQMRITHGCAIYDDEIDKRKLIEKVLESGMQVGGTNGFENISDDELIKLSTNASMLYIIHAHIRNAEKTLFNNKKKGDIASSLLTTDTDNATDQTQTKQSSFANAMSRASKSQALNQKIANANATLKKNSTGTDELSIENIRTETESKLGLGQNPMDLFSETEATPAAAWKASKVNNMSAANTLNTSEYVSGMSTTEADKLYSDYKKNSNVAGEQITVIEEQKGGRANLDTSNHKVENPTLINYWADWCGYSTKLIPEWDKFVDVAKKTYPNLQLAELNVGKNEEFNDLAKRVGVTGYPTIVIFNGDKFKGYKPITKVASGMSSKDIIEHLKNSGVV